MRSIQLAVRGALGLATASAMLGCETTPNNVPTPTRSVMRITNHVGGAHYRTIVHDDHWFQTFSNELLVLDPQTIQPQATLELAPFGECGPATDMAIANDDLYILLRDDRVLHLSIEDPVEPYIVQTRTAADLQLLPRHLSVVTIDDTDVVYVCGDGGATRFDGGAVLFSAIGDIRSVAIGSMGLVGTSGRRAYRADNQTYVGAASELHALPKDEPGDLLFVQHGEQGGLFGMMNSDVREVDARNLTTAAGGVIQRVRFIDGSIWVVTDEQVLAYTPTEDELQLRAVFPVRGALDLDVIRENYLAIAGTFGRAVYRIREDSSGAGDTFVRSHREPSMLPFAISDQMQTLAGTPDQGTWLYRVGSDAQLHDKSLSRAPMPETEAVTDEGTVAINEDSSSVTVKSRDDTLSWRHPRGATLHCVLALEGRIWIGHDAGMTILSVDRPTAEQVEEAIKNELPAPKTKLNVQGDVRLHGPVRYLFALLTNRGVSYVATYSGFGTIEFIEEPMPESDLQPQP